MTTRTIPRCTPFPWWSMLTAFHPPFPNASHHDSHGPLGIHHASHYPARPRGLLRPLTTAPTRQAPGVEQTLPTPSHQSVTAATTGDVIFGNESELAGKGLELLQALIDHFIPSTSVALPDLFKQWQGISRRKQTNSPSFSVEE
jgi:hypothetical protein